MGLALLVAVGCTGPDAPVGQAPEATAAAAPAATPAASPAAAPASAPATPPVFDDNFLRSEPNRYSQFREEVVIRHFFKDRKGGFFLDVGSAEPEVESTTHYLAQELGWKGIAIDARAELAPQYAAKRPGTRFFAYLVTDHTSDKEKFYHSGRLSSGNKDHLKQFAGAQDAKPMEVEIPSTTLNDLLEREKVDHIDFMNMDIEGFEPPALAGFDIDRYKPALVCIESAPGTRAAILEYFTKHGYRQLEHYAAFEHVNLYFAPR